jgi:hypothetical protein
MPTIISEFSPASDGRHYNGTCTQTSAAMALMAADPTLDQSYQGGVNLMASMRDAMYNRGECSANGASTISNMAKEMRNRGAIIDTQINYGGDSMGFDWISFIRAHGDEYAIVLQVAKCSALVSVNPWSANVQYHAICILGKQINGYIVGDPNRPAGNTQPMIYSIQLLQAASPCGMIAIRPKVVVPTAPSGGGNKLIDLPQGWTSQGSGNDVVWRGPASPLDGKQYSVSHGILYFLRNSNWRGGTPIEEIWLAPDGYYYQRWLDFSVKWKDGVGSWDWLGVKDLQNAKKIIDQQIAIDALQKQVAALQAQLSQDRQQETKADLAIQALKEALR